MENIYTVNKNKIYPSNALLFFHVSQLHELTHTNFTCIFFLKLVPQIPDLRLTTLNRYDRFLIFFYAVLNFVDT